MLGVPLVIPWLVCLARTAHWDPKTRSMLVVFVVHRRKVIVNGKGSELDTPTARQKKTLK